MFLINFLRKTKMTLIIVILSVLLAITSYLAYINYIKYNKAIKYAEETISVSQMYVQFISKMWFKFTDTKQRMDEIDRLGAFKSDDQVGHTFTALQECIDDLYEFITKYVDKEEKAKKG